MELSTVEIGSGAPAVLLHGQPGNGRDWSPVVERLRDRLRLIAPDRPGYGRTGGRALGFRANAEAVVALLDRLEIESAVVVAHSWASGVALAMAIDFPQRVRALVLASPVAPSLPPDLVDRLLAHPRLGPTTGRIAFRLAGWGLAVPPVRWLAHMSVPALPPQQVTATAAEWRRSDVWRGFYLEQRALVAELPSLRRRLDEIEQPATILYGTWDLVTRPAHAHRLAVELPNVRLVSARRAGHMLPQQRPSLVASEIARATAI